MSKSKFYVIIFFFFIFLWYLSSSGILISVKTNHQENLETIMQVKFYKEGRNQNLISYYLLFFGGTVFHDPNFLKVIKKISILSNFLKFLFFLLLFVVVILLFLNAVYLCLISYEKNNVSSCIKSLRHNVFIIITILLRVEQILKI